jgi:DnaJ-class molecular chaperone
MPSESGPPLRYEDLVRECRRCEGSGWLKEGVDGEEGSKAKGVCPHCGGNGGQLTEQGRELAKFIDFLRRIGRLPRG